MAPTSHVLLVATGLLHVLVTSQRNSVELDLRQGVVTGYSEHVIFVSSPEVVPGRKCGVQAVIRIDLSGSYRSVNFQLEYDKPRLWTLDISDSASGDGYGGDNGTTSNMAEIQVFNRQMRIYGNDLPGYLDATIDGGLLLKVVDDFVDEGGRSRIEISDEKVRWVEGENKQVIESKFLFTLNGQNATYGASDYDVYVGFNRVVAGNFRNGFGLCRVKVTLEEGDVDECKAGTHDCSPEALCFNTRRSFRCRCKSGFYGNGKICLDDNECEYDNGGCVHHCLNTHGNYSCSCMPGFRLDKDGQNCLDEDECTLSAGGCQHRCENTYGSFRCTCPSGYQLAANGLTCTRRSWCRHACSHHCVNSAQGNICDCRQGYRLHDNGKDCILTCSLGNGGCHHKCTDGSTAPVCSCHAKYMLGEDGKTCTATCGVNNGGCDRRCKDTPAGPQCSCPAGYVLHQDQKTCLDIDECRAQNGGCSHDCVNTHGSYDCICPRGFKVEQDQMTCSDVDECEVKDTCDHACVNTPGTFYCVCRQGYQIYATTHCADEDECSVNNGGCMHTCENSPGSFSCSCNRGYKLHPNKKDCVAAECLPPPTPPKSNIRCNREGRDEVCVIRCLGNAVMTYEGGENEATFRCGYGTSYEWLNDMGNATLPCCSEHVTAPIIRSKARFAFVAPQCSDRRRIRQAFQETLQQDLSNVFREKRKLRCAELCHVQNVALECETTGRRGHRASSRGRGDHHRRSRQQHVLDTSVRAEFELEITPQDTTDNCDLNCVRYRSQKRLKKTMRLLRKSINKDRLFVRFDENAYEVSKNSLTTQILESTCTRGNVLIGDQCVGCSVGSHYDHHSNQCLPCASGTYQDEEASVVCKSCPHRKLGVGIEGARNTSGCDAPCEPGHYSASGLRPCQPCPRGTYQPDYGRTSCRACGVGIATRGIAAVGFQDCSARESCPSGHYYSRDSQTCEPCPLHTYQPELGQDFCVSCPGNTTTDVIAAVNSSFCKDRRCGGHIGTYQGFLESPNWPGEYPHDVDCVWTIVPQKGRRILVVIPEIFLAARDRCGDILVMRKSSSPYSLTTYETCESTETPIAFTSRSKRLWIQFQSNNENSAKGFSIPFVTYNEEYQDLIEDIVRDGRLYSSHQHQEVLKDRKLLSALLEVIAQPYNYFKYANVSRSMFPESFIRLLTPKVRRFFT